MVYTVPSYPPDLFPTFGKYLSESLHAGRLAGSSSRGPRAHLSVPGKLSIEAQRSSCQRHIYPRLAPSVGIQFVPAETGMTRRPQEALENWVPETAPGSPAPSWRPLLQDPHYPGAENPTHSPGLCSETREE